MIHHALNKWWFNGSSDRLNIGTQSRVFVSHQLHILGCPVLRTRKLGVKENSKILIWAKYLFSSFSQYNDKYNTKVVYKSIDGALGVRTRDRRMVGVGRLIN